MATVSNLPFAQIPRQSALFLNYIECAPASLRFYQHPPSLESLENAARTMLKDVSVPRAEIAAILRKQNLSYGCDAVTLDRISELTKPDCVAVVTGQQVGLFTGPLYTIYKALTAIRLADELKHRGIPAVPVFWMDTEDHDLQEVTHRTLVNADSSLRAADYKELLFAQMPTGPVGSIRYPDSIDKVIEDYLETIPEGPFKADIRSQLQSSCRPGSTFCQAFAELLSRSLPGSGLILFDPHDSEAKRLVAPVFEKALQKTGEIRSALLKRNGELRDSGFHAQVTVLDNSTVLFFMSSGERRALEQKGTVFSLKNAGRTFCFEDLAGCANQNPENFSPNVLLRPLVQDHLFPTVAYVGGSAEVAYFAQIEVLYEIYDRPMPIIWPRDSFTLIEPNIGEEMDRLGIRIQDCFQGRQAILEKAIRNSGGAKTSEILARMKAQVDTELTEIKPELKIVEPPLADALETVRRKILHNIQHLDSQLIRREETCASSIAQSADRVINHCYPLQTLQERELGIQYFSARHGSSLIGTIQSAIDIRSFAHHVIRL